MTRWSIEFEHLRKFQELEEERKRLFWSQEFKPTSFSARIQKLAIFDMQMKEMHIERNTTLLCLPQKCES
jgi:hypothetical protein